MARRGGGLKKEKPRALEWYARIRDSGKFQLDLYYAGQTCGARFARRLYCIRNIAGTARQMRFERADCDMINFKSELRSSPTVRRPTPSFTSPPATTMSAFRAKPEETCATHTRARFHHYCSLLCRITHGLRSGLDGARMFGDVSCARDRRSTTYPPRRYFCCAFY